MAQLSICQLGFLLSRLGTSQRNADLFLDQSQGSIRTRESTRAKANQTGTKNTRL